MSQLWRKWRLGTLKIYSRFILITLNFHFKWRAYFKCAIPCFTGLFSQPYEKVILDLLFVLATWHAIAKLRMHSTSSLAVFDGVTKILGLLLRRFTDHVCPKYNTSETPSESSKRARRIASKAAKNKSESQRNLKDAVKVAPNKRNFNLAAYKPHALGHYSSWIRRFGTTDSYSTQTVLFFLLVACITSYRV